MITTRRPLALILVAFLVVFLSLQAYWFLPTILRRPRLFSSQNPKASSPDPYISQSFIDETSGCPILPGIEDVLVVVKTSALVVEKLLPAHLNTSLRCIPNVVIYSDLEEDLEGHHVYDALKELDLNTKVANDDFDLYRRLQLHGRAGLNDEELDASSTAVRDLDKFKYLPIIEKAQQYKRDAKWYILIETSTFILWTTLIQWLARLDPTKAQYIGAAAQHDDQVFAQGASGVIISRPAMNMASEHHANHVEEYERSASDQCTGDCLLGNLLQNAGVPLHPRSWPIQENGTPVELDHVAKVSKNRDSWCYPAVSYSHLTAADINELWVFERDRLQNSTSPIIRHADVFQNYVVPRLPLNRMDWDNLSGRPLSTDEHSGRPSSRSSLESMTREDLKNSFIATSYDACKAKCESEKECMQFSYSPGQCHNSKVVTLGHQNTTHPNGIRSGWLLSRIIAFNESMPACENAEQFWIT